MFASWAGLCALRLNYLNLFRMSIENILFIPRFIIHTESSKQIRSLLANGIRRKVLQRPKAIPNILHQPYHTANSTLDHTAPGSSLEVTSQLTLANDKLQISAIRLAPVSGNLHPAMRYFLSFNEMKTPAVLGGGDSNKNSFLQTQVLQFRA